MPISMTPVNEGRGLLVKGYGHVTDSEYRNFVFGKLLQHPGNKVEHEFCFHDYTEVESVDVANETISQTGKLASALFDKNPHVLMAVAVPSDLLFGLANMWSAWAKRSESNTRLFRDSEAARQWLREEVFGNQAIA
ncbi:MAG: hypothetical protein AAGA33_14915 [Pseudomonadota bacterium]